MSQDDVWLYPMQFHSIILSLFSSLIAPFGGFFASGFKRAFKVKVEHFRLGSVCFNSLLFFFLKRCFSFKNVCNLLSPSRKNPGGGNYFSGGIKHYFCVSKDHTLEHNLFQKLDDTDTDGKHDHDSSIK